jgi:hypothetical protein
MPALERLLDDVVAHAPALHGLDVRSVLVVAREAHGTVAASVRTLDDVARSVVVDGAKKRIELALRPPFFHAGDASRRLSTLVHELLHLDPSTPGALLEERRHVHTSHDDHERDARAIAAAWLKTGALPLLAPLGHDGEVLARSWLHRPVPETEKRRFNDRDVVEAPLVMKTPARARTVWW